MSRALKLDHDFDQKRFRDLLRYIVGDSTQSDFAAKAGISWSTLALQLNGLRTVPPSPQTIYKISMAGNSCVSYSQLLDAAGYDPDKYIPTVITTSDTLNMSSIDKYGITSDLIKIRMFDAAQIIGQSRRISFCPSSCSLNNDFGITILSYPIKEWYFIYSFPDTLHSIKQVETDFDLTIACFTKNIEFDGTAKITVITDSDEIFDFVSSMPMKNKIYFSVAMIDFEKKEITKETEIGTLKQEESFECPPLRLIY